MHCQGYVSVLFLKFYFPGSFGLLVLGLYGFQFVYICESSTFRSQFEWPFWEAIRYDTRILLFCCQQE